MLAAISKASYNYDETLSTLRFADRAKNIKLTPKAPYTVMACMVTAHIVMASTVTAPTVPRASSSHQKAAHAHMHLCARARARAQARVYGRRTRRRR